MAHVVSVIPPCQGDKHRTSKEGEDAKLAAALQTFCSRVGTVPQLTLMSQQDIRKVRGRSTARLADVLRLGCDASRANIV
jgi:hypothetical protein